MFKINTFFAFVLLVCVGFSSVSFAQDQDLTSRGLDPDFPDSLGKLMDLDSKFAALAREKGTTVAFQEYFAEGGIVSKDGGGFLHGLPAVIADLEYGGPHTLTWRPLGGYLAEGSPMGYTYGRYVYEGTDFEGNVVTSHGKYVSIWRKQSDGQWKIVFDMGNTNIPPFDDPLK